MEDEAQLHTCLFMAVPPVRPGAYKMLNILIDASQKRLEQLQLAYRVARKAAEVTGGLEGHLATIVAPMSPEGTQRPS